jgi:hypothetical protein
MNRIVKMKVSAFFHDVNKGKYISRDTYIGDLEYFSVPQGEIEGEWSVVSGEWDFELSGFHSLFTTHHSLFVASAL